MIKISRTSMKNRPFVLIITIVSFASLLVWIITWKLDQRNYIDRSILTDTPCALPCWQNIIPGVTSNNKAMELLSKNSYIEKESIKLAGTNENGGCSWSWRVSGRRMQPTMSWENGIVDTIRMGLTFDLTIQEVIDKWGYPELVEAIEGGTPEYWYWVLTLYYPTQGFQFNAYTPNFTTDITSRTEVGSVVLFFPLTVQEWVEQKEKDLGFSYANHYFTWKGFGNIINLYVH